MFLLLKDITELMKTKTNNLNQQPTTKNEEVSTAKKVIPETNAVSMTGNITFATVIGYLMQQDFDHSFRSLREYLNSINKTQYEFLTIDLIKISLIEQDMAFSKPMIALTYISRENFTFNLSEYIQNFYEALARNRFIEARIYLDIITKSNKLGQCCSLITGLEQVLNTTEKILNYKRNNEVLDKVDACIKVIAQEPQKRQSLEIEKSVEQPMISLPITDDIMDTKKKKIIETAAFHDTPKKVVSEETGSTYDASELIDRKLDELYEKGIILLKPMDERKRKEIHNIVKDIKDVASFRIGSGSHRQIVLRFKPYIGERMNVSATAKEGDRAYSNGDYDTCIKSYRKLLKFGELKAWVYAKLGLAYMQKCNKKMAIDFLTIATYLAKEEQSDFEFTDLIASLKGLIDPEDKKRKVKMSTENFGKRMLFTGKLYNW